MLRPVSLLPAARLTPPRGLLTPRLGMEVSFQYLGPATRRSGAYRDGTLTRWRSAARNRRNVHKRERRVGPFTAHHGGSLRERPQLRLAEPEDPTPTRLGDQPCMARASAGREVQRPIQACIAGNGAKSTPNLPKTIAAPAGARSAKVK